MEIKSPSKSQSARGGGAPGQARASKSYSFKDEHVVSLFKLLQKSNKLKLPEVRRPDEVRKTDDTNYYLYHRMLGASNEELLCILRNCYIFKDILKALINTDVLKLRLK